MRSLLVSTSIAFSLCWSSVAAAQEEGDAAKEETVAPEKEGAETEEAEPAQRTDDDAPQDEEAKEESDEEKEEAPSEAAEFAEPTGGEETDEMKEHSPIIQVDEVTRSMLADENAARTVTNRYGMLVLGAWALGNFGWATVGLLTNEEDPQRAFHLTNAAWNLVNGTIAVFGYFGSISESREENDLLDTLAADHNAEKLYLVNGALDVAYMFGGAYLITKGNLDDKQGLVGTGRSVILQGAFLFAFDAAMFTIHWLRRQAFEKSIGR